MPSKYVTQRERRLNEQSSLSVKPLSLSVLFGLMYRGARRNYLIVHNVFLVMVNSLSYHHVLRHNRIGNLYRLYVCQIF